MSRKLTEKQVEAFVDRILAMLQRDVAAARAEGSDRLDHWVRFLERNEIGKEQSDAD